MTIAIILGLICSSCALGAVMAMMLLRAGAKYDQQMDMSAEDKDAMQEKKP